MSDRFRRESDRVVLQCGCVARIDYPGGELVATCSRHIPENERRDR